MESFRRESGASEEFGDDTLALMDDQKRELPVLVSACLLGKSCRYDGRHNQDDALERELRARGERAIPFCPEEHGGLGTPRPPAWIESGTAGDVVDGRARVVTEDGRDVTQEFLAGARGALAKAREAGARRAYLKERSPSCGVAKTHVEGRLVDGPGITTQLLKNALLDVSGVEGRRR